MLFPLLRSWFRPLFGSRFNSTRTNPKRPSPLHTIGRGLSGQKRSKKSHGETSASYLESQESIVGDVMMRELDVENGENKRREGIMVVNDFLVHDDKASAFGDH